MIVHGAAGGVDAAFGAVAEAQGVAVEPHRAEWVRMGKPPGPSGNQRMVDAGAEFCLAFHRFIANSRGTKDCAGGQSPRGSRRTWSTVTRARPTRLFADDPRLSRDFEPMLPFA